MPFASNLDKWNALVAGHDVGPMVSPLCDSWRLDVPYRWPGPGPEPFPPGHPEHSLGQQLAMAAICGWDATFLAGLPFMPREAALRPKVVTTPIDGGTRVESRTETPYGPLTSVIERKKSDHVLKAELQTRADYQRKTWLVSAQMDYDHEAAVRHGRATRQGVADRGPLGTWFGMPMMLMDRAEGFYHLADFPEAVLELRAAGLKLFLRQLETIRAAGFDYLFLCADGTEWLSPNFWRDYLLEDMLAIVRRWRELGGWILLHSCGKVRKLLELGIYNQAMPEVFETISEPPVGDVPSLAWARQRLDHRIITKGNLPLNVLLEQTPDDVRAGVRAIREQTRGWRHIVGLSDAVLPNTPLANCMAFTDEGRRE